MTVAPPNPVYNFPSDSTSSILRSRNTNPISDPFIDNAIKKTIATSSTSSTSSSSSSTKTSSSSSTSNGPSNPSDSDFSHLPPGKSSHECADFLGGFHDDDYGIHLPTEQEIKDMKDRKAKGESIDDESLLVPLFYLFCMFMVMEGIAYCGYAEDLGYVGFIADDEGKFHPHGTLTESFISWSSEVFYVVGKGIVWMMGIEGSENVG